jgi:hypothetical protein
MSLAMRPIVIAKLLDLTLFGLYLALGFTHSAGDGAASKTCARPPEQPTRSEQWSSAHALGSSHPRGVGAFRTLSSRARYPRSQASCLARIGKKPLGSRASASIFFGAIHLKHGPPDVRPHAQASPWNRGSGGPSLPQL